MKKDLSGNSLQDSKQLLPEEAIRGVLQKLCSQTFAKLSGKNLRRSLKLQVFGRKRGSNKDVFLWTQAFSCVIVFLWQNPQENLFWRASASGCFCNPNHKVNKKLVTNYSSTLLGLLISLLIEEKTFFKLSRDLMFVTWSQGQMAFFIVWRSWVFCRWRDNVLHLSRDLQWPPHWGIMYIYDWEHLAVTISCHCLDKSCNHKQYDNGDMFLIRHVTSPEHTLCLPTGLISSTEISCLYFSVWSIYY